MPPQTWDTVFDLIGKTNNQQLKLKVTFVLKRAKREESMPTVVGCKYNESETGSHLKLESADRCRPIDLDWNEPVQFYQIQVGNVAGAERDS